MIELNGKYNTCKVFTNNIDNTTIGQLTSLMNQQSVEGNKIRIMSDVHAGKGSVIGTTMTLTNGKVIPNIVGVDIGCGVLSVKLKEKRIDLPKLDSVIRKYIPSGGEVHKNSKENKTSLDVRELRCFGKQGAQIREDLAYQSVGTLGGGNHHIELARDKDEFVWLTIHTGSRHLGLEVCDYYQEEAYRRIKDRFNGGTKKDKIDELITKLKSEGRHKDISKEIEKFNKNYKEANPSIPFELAYCEGDLFDDYIHDMKLVQEHASCNRSEIARVILKEMKLHEV